MSKMFYNYINNIDNTDHLRHIKNHKTYNKLETCTCAKYLYNTMGEKLGVTAPSNSIFNLYFNLSSDNCCELSNLLAKSNVKLEVLDHFYDLMQEYICTVDADFNEITAEINTLNLNKGIYHLRLSLETADNTIVLVNPAKNIFNIE